MDRLSAADVMLLITDAGPVPLQIGACLLLDAGPGFDAAAALTGALRQELAECGPGTSPLSAGAHPKQVEGEMPI